MAGKFECMDRNEEELFLKAYDVLLQILGIDDEIDKIKVWARDPKGEPYQVVIRFNKRKLCWQTRVLD